VGHRFKISNWLRRAEKVYRKLIIIFYKQTTVRKEKNEKNIFYWTLGSSFPNDRQSKKVKEYERHYIIACWGRRSAIDSHEVWDSISDIEWKIIDETLNV